MVALPVLAALVYAIVALIIGVGIYLVGKALVSVIPHLPLIGWYLRNAIESAIEWVVSRIWSWLISPLYHVVTVIMSWATAPVRFVEATVATLFHLYQQIWWLHYVFIPEQQTKTEQGASSAAAAEVHHATETIDHRVNQVGHAAEVALELGHSLDHYVHDALGLVILHAEAEAEHTAEAWSSGQIRALHSQLGTEISQVQQAELALAHAVTSTIPHELAALGAQQVADLAEAKQAAAADAANATATASRALAAAVATLEAADQATRATALAAVAAAEANLEQALQAQAQAEGAALVAVQDALQGQITTLQTDLAGVEGAVSVTIPAAIAAVAAQVAPLVAEAEDCWNPMCSWWNGIENDLAKLLQLASVAGVLGFLAEAIAQPDATASEFTPIAEGVYNLGSSALHALLSL